MITGLLKKSAKFLWLVPGLLLWASFPPMGEKTDCFFALAPLLWLSRTAGSRPRDGDPARGRRKEARRNVLTWLANGFVFWFATLAWMPAIVKNGGPMPLVVLGWGALAGYCALYFAAFGWLSGRYWSWARGDGAAGPRGYGWRLAGILVVEPALWAGLEIVRSRLLGGFAWNQLGVAPVNGGFGAPAALGGVYLVSALVVMVNGTLASVAERMFAPRGSVALRAARSVETFAPLAAVYLAYACAARCLPDAAGGGDPAHGEDLRVALVQRNFPCVFARGERENPVDVYSRLFSTVGHVRPGLVVLAESAFSEFGDIGSPGARDFAKWALRQTGAAAVVGGGGCMEDGKMYNSAALYEASGEEGGVSLQRYDKVHLVPFGEYIPGDKTVTALQRLAPVGSCSPGTLKTLRLPGGVDAGVAICYEDTDSAQMRALAKAGARLLVFITNDSWFSRSDEAVQHAWQSVARALETGLPAVRVGNSGVTGSILPDGRCRWLEDAAGRPLVDTAAAMCDIVVPAASGRATPYVRLGDAPLFCLFLAVAAFSLLAGRGRRHTVTPCG